MDVQKTYPINDDFHIILGWSDREQHYHGRLEGLHIQEGVPYEYRILHGYQDFNEMLEQARIDVVEMTGVEWFEVPAEDISEFQQAPTINSEPTLYPINMLDTEYAAMLAAQTSQPPLPPPSFEQFLTAIGHDTQQYSDDAELEDLAQEQADALAELELCVFHLEALREGEQGLIENDRPDMTVEARQRNIVAQTAAMLASNVYAIAVELRNETFTTMANSEGIEHWDIDTLLDDRELALIDAYCENLCGSRLSAFIKSVERGFNPVNGVPLSCRNPAAYDQAALFPSPDTEQLYEQYMSPQEAAETARIQRLDARQRTEGEWAYLAMNDAALCNLHSGQDRG